MAGNYHILGGGVGGLCTAIALQKKKVEFTLYEKASEITYEEVGLGISRNIFPIFREWGLLEKVQSTGGEVRQMIFVDKKMKPLRSLLFKHPALSVDRKKFYEVLANELLPESIRLASPKSFEEFPPEEVVIAADGAFSETRRKLYPNIPLRRSGQTLWRGMVSLELDHSFHHTYFDFVGGNTRFAIIHTGENLYSWYAVRANSTPEEEAAEPKEMLLELLKEHAPVAKEVVLGTEKIYKSELVDIKPADRKGIKWYAGNLVMIGDAIHPTTPNMANGACLAIEDAYVVTSLLRDHQKNPVEAFQLYQLLREKKVNTIVRRSWALGQMMHQQNKIMDSLMLAGTRLTPQWTFDLIYSGVLNDESLRKVREES